MHACTHAERHEHAPCRVAVTMSADTLLRIAASTRHRIHGDTVTFAFRSPSAHYVTLTGGIGLSLERLPGTDVWAASVHVPNLAEARISYRLLTDTTYALPPRYEVRGQSAAARPLRSARLAGTLRFDTLESAALHGSREVISYLPPGWHVNASYDVVYAADGVLVKQLAPLVDTLIARGELAPVVLVGVRAARPVPGVLSTEHDRQREYLLGFQGDSARFLAHERFFVEEVSQWAERVLHVRTNREARTIWGSSNGGAFAIAIGMRHPDRFAHVIAASPVYNDIEVAREPMLPKFTLSAGSFERVTRERMLALAAHLRKAGAETHTEIFTGGHDELIWTESFSQALRRSSFAAVPAAPPAFVAPTPQM